jgi:hypothetical protein
MARATDLGLEQASTASPEAAEHILPSGRIIQWRMPDVLTIISFAGTIPDPVTAAVIKLLLNEGSYTPEDDPRSYHHKVEQIRGMYGIVAAGMVRPKMDATREWGDGETLGRRDLAWADVEFIYHVLFRIGSRGERLPAPDSHDAARLQEPPPAGDDLPPPAE